MLPRRARLGNVVGGIERGGHRAHSGRGRPQREDDADREQPVAGPAAQLGDALIEDGERLVRKGGARLAKELVEEGGETGGPKQGQEKDHEREEGQQEVEGQGGSKGPHVIIAEFGGGVADHLPWGVLRKSGDAHRRSCCLAVMGSG